MKVQGAVVVTLMSALAWALASHFKVLRQSFFVLWARHCQVSYPVRGQVLLQIEVTSVIYKFPSLNDKAKLQTDLDI